MTFVTQEQLNEALEKERQQTRVMIDVAISGASAAQESRWNVLKQDIHSIVLDSVTEAVQPLEKRVSHTEQETRLLRRELFGDPNERSGPRSIYEMIQGLVETVSRLEQVDQKHSERIAHFDRLERLAISGARLVGSAAMRLLPVAAWIKTLLGFFASLLPLLLTLLLGALGGLTFFMSFLFSLYS